MRSGRVKPEKASYKESALKNEEAGRRLREWKDFPRPVARWTLDRV